MLSGPAVADGSKKKITNQVDLVTSIFETGSKILNSSKEYWRKNFAYSIVISEKDSLYGDVFDWLISINPDERHHSLTVSSSRNPRDDEAVGENKEVRKIKPLVVRFNAGTSKSLKIDGHIVRVSVLVPEVSSSNTFREHEYSKIEFVMRSHTAQKAVLAQLEKLNAQRTTSRKAVLKMVTQWSNWTTRSDLPPRSMASVALPDEQKKRIVKDLKEFLESEDTYNRLAIPWHRGYMFYGPPGTGKTSLVKALANEFNLDLWYVSLSDLKAEASLISLMSEVGPRSLLLLEDIDTIKITHDRDNTEQGKISMSSLLNTLDGVATPHGLIAVMTTNRFEVLDPALTRAGRMDLIEHLDYPTMGTLADMYKHFYGAKPKWSIFKDGPIEGLSTSEVSEIMKRHMHDAKGASLAVLSLIKEKSDEKD